MNKKHLMIGGAIVAAAVAVWYFKFRKPSTVTAEIPADNKPTSIYEGKDVVSFKDGKSISGVFRVYNGKKHGFPNPETYEANGGKWNYTKLTEAEFAAIPNGRDIGNMEIFPSASV